MRTFEHIKFDWLSIKCYGPSRSPLSQSHPTALSVGGAEQNQISEEIQMENIRIVKWWVKIHGEDWNSPMSHGLNFMKCFVYVTS